jgi:hypothetical protein
MEVSKTKVPSTQPTQALARTEENKSAQRRETQAKEEAPKKAAEPKRQPVVNAQGQTTGRLLNVTA